MSSPLGKPALSESCRNTRIFLLRHAESGNNARAEGIMRNYDPHLTDLGMKQAENLGEFFARQEILKKFGDIKHVFISPQTRTIETAAPLFRKCREKNIDVKFKVQEDIHEEGGLFDGSRQMNEEERSQKYPRLHRGLTDSEIVEKLIGANALQSTRPDNLELSSGITAEGWWRGGRETDADFEARVRRVVEWMGKLEENALFVTHGQTIDSLIKAFMKMQHVTKPSSEVFFPHGNCALTCLEVNHAKGTVGFIFMNRIFISEALQTGHGKGGFNFRPEDFNV